jgi:hypothetical protein
LIAEKPSNQGLRKIAKTHYNILNFLPGSLVVKTGEGDFLTTFSAVLPKRM